MPRVRSDGVGPTPSSVERALSLLEAFRLGEGSVRLVDLASRTGLTRSTAHRLLNVMANRGFVIALEEGRYGIGLKMWDIGLRSMRPGDLIGFAQPYLQELATMSGETAHLAIRDGYEAIYLARVVSPQRVAAQTQVGMRVPLYCTATGKALVAFGGEDVVAEVMKGKRVKVTPETVIDERALRKELEQTRERGYSVNIGQQHSETAGVAAPLFGVTGHLIAAFGLAGPRYHFSDDRMREFGELVKRVCREASNVGFVN